jgi:transposase
MAAKFVSPYRMAGKSGKNDAADAQAICEAVRRPHMRFVPVKDESQQDAMPTPYPTGFYRRENSNI